VKAGIMGALGIILLDSFDNISCSIIIEMRSEKERLSVQFYVSLALGVSLREGRMV
jgi:hypothetical protein